GRQDDERLTDRDHTDDHHLLQHERQVLTRPEAITPCREEEARNAKGKERTERRDAGEPPHGCIGAPGGCVKPKPRPASLVFQSKAPCRSSRPCCRPRASVSRRSVRRPYRYTRWASSLS